MASAIEQQFSNVFFYDSCSRVGSTLFVGPSNGARTNALLLLPFRWHLQSNNSFRMFSFMIPALALGRLCLSVRQMEQGLISVAVAISMASAIEQQFSNVFSSDSCSRVGSTLFVGPSNGAKTNVLLLLPFDGICNRTTVFECFLL